MHVTPPVAEDPVAHEFVSQRKGHYHEAEKKIRHRETGDKPILDIFQGLFRHNGNNDQHVAHYNDNHKDCDNYRGDHDVKERVTARINAMYDSLVCVVAKAMDRTNTPLERRIDHGQEIIRGYIARR